MKPTNCVFTLVLLMFCFLLPTVLVQAENATPLTPREQTIHALNRMAFGPQPGQVERVSKMGWKKWAERQLEPESIDDGELDKRLKENNPSLFMGSHEIEQNYMPPRLSKEEQKNLSAEERQKLNKKRNQLRGKLGNELISSVIVRAAQSERQFQEVIVEFWRNHLNVYLPKVRYAATHYEQSVIRKHAFGKFDELIMASAKHPAMLIYLDNHISKSSGLNENYARELMELHTLGVDNHYTQEDVVELARVLTGWTCGRKKDGDGLNTYGFIFNPRFHDKNPAKIVGLEIEGDGGLGDGEKIVLHLARHKGTAQYVSTKLCRYLVSDNPSQELIDRVTQVFLKTNGDLRKVYRAIIFSDEFIMREHFKTKFKTPFEFVISWLRAANAPVKQTGTIARTLTEMGQPIYMCDVPTGYSDQAEAWLDPGVMAYRWEYSVKYTQVLDKRGAVSPQVESWKKLPPREMAEKVRNMLIPGEPVESAVPMLMKGKGLRGMTQLALGSPAFQQQ